jgi:hypothetical protein
MIPARHVGQSLPRAQQLAALGTVLCLYRPQDGSELSGWARAVRAESRVGVDSDGLRESLAFFDHQGRFCWRLYLLPDSDFVAWDGLLALLPSREEADVGAGLGERLWRRLAGRLLGDQWQACLLRLHVVPVEIGRPVLAASLATVSPLGAATARHIARAEGAELNIRADEYRCAAPSLSALHCSGARSAVAEQALPPVRFSSRAP